VGEARGPTQFKKGSNKFKWIQIRFQIHSNSIWSKHDLPKLERSEIKYGLEDLGKTNNFLHRNFFNFGRYME
jgi:hypothetical protein